MNEPALATSYADLIDNPTPRCPCLLVLDTSASMAGAPIQALNAGIQQFIDEVRADDFASQSVEVGVVTFGGTATLFRGPTPVNQIDGFQSLQANGGTPMGAAVELAIAELARRKSEYQKTGVSYYQPWVVLMSDGAPTDDYQATAQRLKALAEQRKVVVFAIGIGPSADLNVLGEFSNRPAKALDGLKFREFFAWLSMSMSRVSQSTPGTAVKLAPTAGWDSI